jgi:hypothetical protein
MLADNYDLDVRVKALNFPRGVQTVEAGHADVHYDDFRMQSFGFLNRVLAVHRFPTERDGGFSGEYRADAPPDKFMIIYHQDSHQPRLSMEQKAAQTTSFTRLFRIRHSST